jgi:peptidyl-tRNA hydrolase, PTH1 family
MFLITGLGNPGKEYENTPHNAGFMFLDILKEELSRREDLQVSDWIAEEKLFLSHICKIKREGELIGILQKPITYMNRSGSAVKLVHNKFDIQKYILVHDDLDIQLGKYKIQEEKSPKGHNGVLSIESALGTTNFTRVRIGIENREDRRIPGEDYVLKRYSALELQTIEECIYDSIKELTTTFVL